MELTQPWCFIRRQLALDYQKGISILSASRPFPFLIYSCVGNAWRRIPSSSTSFDWIIGHAASQPEEKNVFLITNHWRKKKSATKSEGEIENCL